jgi:hypothetical protein
MTDLTTMTAADLGRAIENGRADPRDVAEAFLAAAAAHPDAPRIYARMTETRARVEAGAAAARARAGLRRHPLDGVPVSWKDLYAHEHYAYNHLIFSFLSDHTYNRVGYVDLPLDSLAPLDLGDRVLLDDDTERPMVEAAEQHTALGLDNKILGLDHMATRVLAGDREDAILEYLTMVPYYFWGAYNINEMNSSTNVTRNPKVNDDKLSPARVFTANNTPSYLNSLVNLPMPTEEFVRNFGRRMHHLALEVADGKVDGEQNVDVVVRKLQESGIPFLADVVGECSDQPNLKQIFSKSSDYSLLITEYVQRCQGYDGFFTRENVASLTEAAGNEERYAHGHVFD